MKDIREANRRTVLKTIGAGAVGSTVLAGTASARGGKGGGNSYGNGNAIGKFLNEEAKYKESPVWDTGVADRTGQDEVDVLFGGMTSIDLPDPEAPDEGPWGMDPRAVKVSPGTEVTWTWYDGPGAINAHHLVSFFDPPYDDKFTDPFAEEDHNHEHPGGEEEFYVKEELGDTFTNTFDDVGTYLYFCIPHGIPKGIEIENAPPEVPNLFGQRGAVKVVDD